MSGPVNNSLSTQIEPVEPIVTYVGVPMVTVNVATSLTHIPTNLKVLVGTGLAQSSTSIGTVSLGDQMGLGVASGINSGPDIPVIGNPKVMMGPGLITSFVMPHLQDLSNGAGMSLIPGQFTVMSAI